MTKSVAFHSYKGGTGKTTLAANLAAALARNGNRVILIDMDVYAPSLHSYFERQPTKWVNDFLNDEAITAKDILYDLTAGVLDSGTNTNSKNARLYAVFSNPKKEEINKLEVGNQNSRLELLRRFVELKEELMGDLDADYLLIDTSPGIRYWSINALAVSDLILLTLKMGDLDVRGTRKMADDIYSSFTDFGAKSFLLMNRVAGFCVPPHTGGFTGLHKESPQLSRRDDSTPDSLIQLSRDIGMGIISSIPCYCDIQFSNKEFLTIMKFPSHPFSQQIDHLASDEHVL